MVRLRLQIKQSNADESELQSVSYKRCDFTFIFLKASAVLVKGTAALWHSVVIPLLEFESSPRYGLKKGIRVFSLVALDISVFLKHMPLIMWERTELLYTVFFAM